MLPVPNGRERAEVMGLGTNRGSPSPQGPEHCAQGTTHPEDVSVAAEAITPIAREASADPLTSPHCLAGGLGWGWGRETRPSVQHPYGKLISTYPPRLCSPSSPILSLCACPLSPPSASPSLQSAVTLLLWCAWPCSPGSLRICHELPVPS